MEGDKAVVRATSEIVVYHVRNRAALFSKISKHWIIFLDVQSLVFFLLLSEISFKLLMGFLIDLNQLALRDTCHRQ